jgi:hypothetical protein
MSPFWDCVYFYCKEVLHLPFTPSQRDLDRTLPGVKYTELDVLDENCMLAHVIEVDHKTKLSAF